MDAKPLRTHIGPLTARLVVLFAGLLLLLPGLGGARLLTYHEVVFAQPAREMLASGRWLVPEIAGVVFPDKPPLAHWAAAVGMALLGQNEFAVRLPFALAGVLLACLVTELGIAFWGAAPGGIAGLVQLTCFYTPMQARLAECDILLALAVAVGLSAFTFVEVLGRSFTWRHAFVLHLGSAGAFLAKGPIGLVFIGAPVLTHLLVERRIAKLSRWMPRAGLLVSLLAIVGWPLAAAWTRPEIIEGWKRNNLDRFSGALEGEGTWPTFYLRMIPLILLPWTPWIFWGWLDHRRTEKPEIARLRRFTLCWIIPGLVVISASSWRHKHYAVPLLPLLSLWGAEGLRAWARTAGRASANPLANPRGRIAIAAVLFGGGLLLAVCLSKDNFDVLWPLALWVAVATAAVSQMRSMPRPRLATLMLFSAVGVTTVWSLQYVVPRFDSYAEQGVFAERVAARVGSKPLFVPHIPTGPSVPLALPENQIAFYLPLNLRLLPNAAGDTHAEWVLAPASMGSRLPGFSVVDSVNRLRGSMKPEDRLTLFRRMAPAARRDPRETQYAN